MPDSLEHQPRIVRRFFGGLMIAVGALIALLSGLCTLGALMAFVSGALRESSMAEFISTFLMFLFVGGIPFVIGVALIFGGNDLMVSSKPTDTPDGGPDAG